MSVDLDAERAASAERREERDFELWLGHRAGMLRSEGDVSLEAARKLWPSKDDDYLRQVVARAERDIQRGRQTLSDVWDGADMVERGAELFREHPEASLRAIYEILEEEADGRSLGLSQTTWVNAGYGRRARDLSKEMDGESDAPSEDPPQESSHTPEPASEPSPPVEEPGEQWGRPPGLEEEADSILLELGGQRFEAWRSGEEWEVEFSGTLDTVGMQEIMGRVLEGVA